MPYQSSIVQTVMAVEDCDEFTAIVQLLTTAGIKITKKHIRECGEKENLQTLYKQFNEWKKKQKNELS